MRISDWSSDVCSSDLRHAAQCRARRSSRCATYRSSRKSWGARQEVVQRRKQPTVLFGAADADPGALRQAVAGHRPQDDATVEQRLFDARSVFAELDQQEVGLRRGHQLGGASWMERVCEYV